MTSCRARTGREKDGLRVWEPIESSLRRYVVQCDGERYVCENEKKNRGSKPRRKRLQKKRLRRVRGGKRGRGRWRPTHSLTVCRAHSQQRLGHSRCSLTAYCVCPTFQLYMFIDVDARLLRPRLRTMHDRSAHDQLVFIASNTVGSCSKSNSEFPASSPRGRWRCASTRQLSTRNLQVTSLSNLKYHVATGMSEELCIFVFPRTFLHVHFQIP
jgi:hypothetical protein